MHNNLKFKLETHPVHGPILIGIGTVEEGGVKKYKESIAKVPSPKNIKSLKRLMIEVFEKQYGKT